MERMSGPTVLSLTRQNIPNIGTASAEERRQGVLKGGYVIKKEEGALERILIATVLILALAYPAYAASSTAGSTSGRSCLSTTPAGS